MKLLSRHKILSFHGLYIEYTLKDIWVWSILWQLALPEFCNIHEIALKQINMYLALKV